ncbi:MAG: hypothetical protein ACRC10_10150 [Thermoguttaceae bacterium]
MIRNSFTYFLFFLLCLVVSLSFGVDRVVAQEKKNGNIIEFLGVLDREQAQEVVLEEGCILVPLKLRSGNAQSENLYYFRLNQLSSLEVELLHDAANGDWNQFDLFRAALIAEGHVLPEITQCEERFQQVVVSVRAQLAQNVSLRNNGGDAAKVVFETLHKELLIGEYDINVTDPLRVITTGDYNCVSATVLYNALAQRCGLKVCGLETAGHVLSRAKYASQFVDLETTCPNWFSLKSEKEKKARIEDRVQTAKPNLNEGSGEKTLLEERIVREISDVQLIATVYYNQGFDHWQHEQFAESIVDNVKALYLDPENETIWGNLVGAINNLAINFASKHHQYDLAAGLLEQIEVLEPNFASLKGNQLHIYYSWIKSLSGEGRISEAEQVYQEAEQHLPGNVELSTLMQSVQRMKLK